MFDEFVRGFHQAVRSGAFENAERLISKAFPGVTIAIGVGADPAQPFTVVTWQVTSAKPSRLMLAAQMPGHPRAEFTLVRLGLTIPMLAAYHRAGAPIPGQVDLNMEDHLVWPGLSFCDTGRVGLLPDPVFVGTQGYRDIGEHFAAQPVAWEDRARVAFWRGATTGRIAEGADWWELPRVRLCEVASAQPDLLDVGISSAIDAQRQSERLRAAGFWRDYAPPEDLQRYRYQIDIDGNTNSWPGLFQKLLTGSPVLKVASPHGFRQWYYDRLVPWVNYVPVQSDMADLADKVHWLRAHDAAARMIGKAGRRLALSMDCAGEIEASAGVIAAALAVSGWAAFERTIR